MKCPNCKAESSGQFCSSCGTPLGNGKCRHCGARLTVGARFCTQCGQRVSARGGTSSAVAGANMPWIIAGAAIVVAIIAVLLPTVRGTGAGGNATTPGGAPFASGATSPGQPPPLTGTPREQADRLFNRIMQERSAGNEEQARFFVPMAVQAYQAAGPLDADGLYHLSLIHAVGQDFTAARTTAEQILQSVPNHLLALAALAEAATGAGDAATARTAWTRFLENFETEKAAARPEYQDHARILDQYLTDARSATSR